MDRRSRASAARCPACGGPLDLVFVHGHGQCAACGQNVVPCCSGAGDEADARDGGGVACVDDLVAVLSDGGGTMTREALLNRFAARTGCTWSDGEELLRAGLESGHFATDARGDVALARR